MSNIDIVNRYIARTLIYRSETAATLGEAVKEALGKGISLCGSDLRGLDLRDSDLRGLDLRDSDLRDSNFSDSNFSGSNFSGSNFSGSDLSDSNFSGSNLSGSNFSGSDLSDSNFSGSNFSDSNLSGSDFSGSNLSGSNLRGTHFRGSNLRGTRFRGSNLSGSDLSGSNFSGSNLSSSDLSGTNLSNSDLRDSDLREIRDDFFAVLEAAPSEVCGLLVSLRLGRVDGSTYEGACSCLLGTLGNVRGCRYDAISGLSPDEHRPAERWFLAIRPGITPSNHPVAEITEGWIVDWLKGNRPFALAVLAADDAVAQALAALNAERLRLAAGNDSAGLSALAARLA